MGAVGSSHLNHITCFISPGRSHHSNVYHLTAPVAPHCRVADGEAEMDGKATGKASEAAVLGRNKVRAGRGRMKEVGRDGEEKLGGKDWER